MKKIGNIIVNGPNCKVDKCYNKFLSLSDVDNSLPTMVVGFENAKKNIKDFSVFEKSKNHDMLWWTFSKTEKRSDYDSGMKLFFNKCINNIINNIKYYYIDIIKLTYTKARNIINYIKSDSKKLYYVDNNKFVFIYDTEITKNIYGISLNTCSFYGISKKKIIKRISDNKSNERINDFLKIPNNVRWITKDEVPKEMVLLEYFS